MEPIKIVIDGANFSDMDGFYDEMERLLTKDLDWRPGHNLDAFNDLLRGGFGVHEYGRPLDILWLRSEKSRKDLGFAAFDRITEIILDSGDSGHDCTLTLDGTRGDESMRRYKSIAIDGPSGAGKSTLARALARELGFMYLDTGAIYRTVGLFALRRGVEPTDGERVAALLPEIRVELTYGADGLQRMLLNGEDVTAAIREHRVSAYASEVSAIPAVRDFLLDMQRETAKNYNVVMDGRDIGTVVLPEADLKIFLTAAPEARARRRYAELLERGETADYGRVLQDVTERDRRDMSRAVSPLKQAEDAVVVDTTQLSLEESFRRLLALAKEKVHE